MKRFLVITILSFFVLPSVWGQSDFQKYRAKRQQEFREYQDKRQREFEEYRRKRNEELAKRMDHSWQPFRLSGPVARPVEREQRPTEFDERTVPPRDDKKVDVEVMPYKTPAPKPQPEPIVPILENDESGKDVCSFTFYGTPMQVRCGDLRTFRLTATGEKALSPAYLKLTNKRYDNLLYDCLELRKRHALCDWAYFKLLEAMAEAVCGKGTNEAVLLQGVLFNQSGYRVRFASEPGNGRLHLLVGVEGNLFDCESIGIKGKVYYLFDKSRVRDVHICNLDIPEEREMVLHIRTLPLLSVRLSEARTIRSESYGIVAVSAVNRHLLDFFADYPTSYANDDFMTRWAYYANTPASKEMREKLYPQLRERLQLATDQRLAVNMLLNWVQTGFEYEFDEKLWNCDRAFFAEETLFYPFSDCEDRAILFSRLVRDLLGLDVALVFYYGRGETDLNHLSTAVAFTEPVEGDYIMVEERRFIVADPTYIRAKVGRTAPAYDNEKAKVILCERR